VSGHLLEMAEFQEAFYDGAVARMAAAGHLRVGRPPIC